VLSSVLRVIVSPLCSLLKLDPGIFGSILAIDMGGFQLSVDLAADPRFGLFSGVVVSSIFGCTLVFSIPVGLGFIGESDRPYFTKGILLGLATMPVSILVSALMLKLPLLSTLWNCLPVLLISLLLGIGVTKKPEAMMKGFQTFAKAIRSVAILGLTLAAVSHLSGKTLLKNLLPLQDAMKTVSSICIVMLGSMPLAELIQRILKVPFARLEQHTGLNGASSTGFLLGLFTATPALAMIPKMNRRGQVVGSACLVSCVCSFGAHFAYANSFYPDMVPAMLAAKLVGGVLGGVIAMAATRNMKE
jgi:ethanolamine transporter